MVFSFLQRRCHPLTRCFKKIAGHPCYKVIFYLRTTEHKYYKRICLCLQAKLSHLGHRKPARIHWKADAPKQVTVWCGFWSTGIIVPFFFENKQGDAVTANGNGYQAMLNEFLFTKIEEEDIGNIWFQQDRAT